MNILIKIYFFWLNFSVSENLYVKMLDLIINFNLFLTHLQ